MAGVVGHGVGKGASFIKRGFRGKKDDENNGSIISPSIPEIPTIVTNDVDSPSIKRSSAIILDGEGPPPALSNGARTHHNRTSSMGAASINSLSPSAPGQGTAIFNVISASGYPPSSDIYVIVKQLTPKEKVIAKTKHHETPGTIHFDETFKHKCTPDTQFRIEVKGHHTFGSDDEFGEALYFVDESGTGEKEIKVGSGTVVLKSTFESSQETPRPSTSGGGMRRSFLSKREPRTSRESTPSL